MNFLVGLGLFIGIFGGTIAILVNTDRLIEIARRRKRQFSRWRRRKKACREQKKLLAKQKKKEVKEQQVIEIEQHREEQ